MQDAEKQGGAARCPPCSQNAHGETVLVRCAQLRAALAIPLKRGKEGKALAGDKARLGVLGWVGEKAGLFEHPVWCVPVSPDA